jgi:hypothetical protein
MKNGLSYAFFFLFVIAAQAQDSTLLYMLKENERVIYRDENRLLIQNTRLAHLMFLQRPSGFFILYGGKEFGPYKAIQFSESNPSLFDWAVSKDGKWYQLVLDKGLLLGPYDEVVDVYRSSSRGIPGLTWNDAYGDHFGFRFKKNDQWYVNINGMEKGPWRDLGQGYPAFHETPAGLYAFYGNYNMKDSVLVDKTVVPARTANFWNSDFVSREGKKIPHSYGTPEGTYGFIFDTDHYYYPFEEEGKYYYYVSSLSKAIGPFDDSYKNIFINRKGSSYAYTDLSKIIVNGNVVHDRGFALTYDPEKDSFCWLSVSGRGIYLHRAKA